MKETIRIAKNLIKNINDEYFALSDNDDMRHLELQNRLLTRISFLLGLFAMVGWVVAIKKGGR